MTLFIACLLISEFNMNAWLYVLALFVWLLHLFAHAEIFSP